MVDLHESFDDANNVYRIRLEVRNNVFGFLFGYEGEFTCDVVPASLDELASEWLTRDF